MRIPALAALAVALVAAGCSSSSTGAGSTGAVDAGPSDGGATTGGASTSGSTGHHTTGGTTGLTTTTGSGGTSGTTGTGSTTGTGGTTGGLYDAGNSWVCDFDGGAKGGSCLPECDPGFHCEGGANGHCVLNGGGGDIQVTLRWNQGVDLDLHVIEPGGCEVYYGDTNRPGQPSSCGASGSLDLDSNPGCSLDNVDIENVIYADGGVPPSGTYIVRVDNFADDPSSCAGGGQPIPFEVVIRHGGTTDTICSGFGANTADGAGADGGVTIATFTYP